MGQIHVCAHNSSMGVHVHYIHTCTYASVGWYTRGAGAESYVTKWTALVIMMSASCMTQISTFLGIPKQTT